MSSHRLDCSPTELLQRAALLAEVALEGWGAGGPTARQLAVLMTVAAHEGLNQMDIVAKTGIDRSTTADIVARLVRKRFLQRRRSRSDSRAYILKLSDEGKRVLHAAEPLAASVDARILKALPDARREAFVECLRAIVSSQGPAADAAAHRATPVRQAARRPKASGAGRAAGPL